MLCMMLPQRQHNVTLTGNVLPNYRLKLRESSSEFWCLRQQASVIYGSLLGASC